jgi:hypothetical protein
MDGSARGEWHTETIDHLPGNLQCLKFAGRLLEMRFGFDQEAPTATGALAEVDEYTTPPPWPTQSS